MLIKIQKTILGLKSQILKLHKVQMIKMNQTFVKIRSLLDISNQAHFFFLIEFMKHTITTFSSTITA